MRVRADENVVSRMIDCPSRSLPQDCCDLLVDALDPRTDCGDGSLRRGPSHPRFRMHRFCVRGAVSRSRYRSRPTHRLADESLDCARPSTRLPVL
jgi:hypothetical protein